MFLMVLKIKPIPHSWIIYPALYKYLSVFFFLIKILLYSVGWLGTYNPSASVFQVPPHLGILVIFIICFVLAYDIELFYVTFYVFKEKALFLAFKHLHLCVSLKSLIM